LSPLRSIINSSALLLTLAPVSEILMWTPAPKSFAVTTPKVASREAPAISTAPLISKVAASSSPEIVKFLWPVVSMLPSVVTTLEAIAVPAVKPSSSSNSASARTALPAVNAVPVTTPPEVIAPVVVIVSM